MLDQLSWNDAGLLPVVAQDRSSGVVRMVAWANREAVALTLRSKEAHFFSRSRGRLWKKGEESGNILAVTAVWADCDGDTLLYLVDAVGPSCHLGHESCFFRGLTVDDVQVGSANLSVAPGSVPLGRPILAELDALLRRRSASSSEQSYTKSLLAAGATKIGDKVREEADEFATALTDESADRGVEEAADIVYHLLVGLQYRERSLADVARVLANRFGTSGHAEKASRGQRPKGR